MTEMTLPDIADEYAHKPSEQPDWRESYYFNFVDADRGISGFTTIGLLPNVRKREFVFALFHHDKRETYFVEPDGPIPESFVESLADSHLAYELVKPLNEWRVTFHGENTAVDLRWKARFPVYDFGTGSGTSWSGHFEQSESVTGTIQFSDGQRVRINGLGERDKSWGARDWHIEGWYALHAQFDTFSIGLRRDIVRGQVHSSGFISSRRGNMPISSVEVETGFSSGKEQMPIRATTHVSGVDGSNYTLESVLISPTSFVKFSRQFPGGSTDLFENMAMHEYGKQKRKGTGLTEWLFTHRGS
ncbi:MAG: hypothetical protein C4K47_03265 [Candidatus Thorarchaeota archaeon]|nr:MAG: hypothetical protein C4K47_03265 [Candidatus Thorarchaeota archaeon]